MYVLRWQLCGDNAAMIGAQGYYEYLAGNLADQTPQRLRNKVHGGRAAPNAPDHHFVAEKDLPHDCSRSFCFS